MTLSSFHDCKVIDVFVAAGLVEKNNIIFRTLIQSILNNTVGKHRKLTKEKSTN